MQQIESAVREGFTLKANARDDGRFVVSLYKQTETRTTLLCQRSANSLMGALTEVNLVLFRLVSSDVSP